MSGGLTWQRLRDLGTSELTEAGDAWHRVSSRADADRTRVDRAMTAKLRETQEGEAAEAALHRLRRLSRNFQYVHGECGLVRTTLNGLAAELAEPRRRLRDALADAAAQGLTVHDDGSVGYPAAEVTDLTGTTRNARGGTVRGSALLPLDPRPLGAPPADFPGFAPPNPRQARAQEVADRIARALRSATEIDTRYARALAALKAEQGLDVTEATLRDVRADTAGVRTAADRYLDDTVPRDASPADRRRWWDGLTDEQRREYLEIAPDLIGGLDGIPAAARDEANRTRLPLLIDELSRRDDGDARTKLTALRMIQDKLSEPSNPPMYLLGIGTEGNGRAIISYGDPDASRNVSAYVPGWQTKLDEGFVDDTMKRARDTAVGARDVDPSSASIIWLGYDAPQHVDVMTRGDAQRGAPAYNEFMEGLAVTNRNEDAHLTAIGHSYGSLTVGTAAQRPGGIPGADDIIILGSPGVDAQKAEELGVGRGHVFVGAADNDPVTHTPAAWEAGLFATMLPVTDRGADDAYFGKDPASEAFGARRFKVDDGPRMLRDLGGFDAHSQYFTPETDAESATNIARIVAGQPEKITTEERR
ncbi:alpha/beta hydrolase [Streptomyces termitum]|uniref:alpha/beta hydrolase n=1 Tax=Streptomyces termitum TaxID=67368 RepID=UPI0033BFAD2C